MASYMPEAVLEEMATHIFDLLKSMSTEHVFLDELAVVESFDALPSQTREAFMTYVSALVAVAVG